MAKDGELRGLPSVGELAAALEADDGGRAEAARDGGGGSGGGPGASPGASPGPLAVMAARAAIEERRGELLGGTAGGEGEGDLLLERARARLRAAREPALRRVINATGVVLHTNLGRAPLAAAAARQAAELAQGYSNLELDLGTGRRGSRHEHVAGLLRELTGAEAAIAVNNGAAATLLAAAALAGPGHSIIVSRGQLVEIGGSFRIPDVVAASGARLVEVGTTNRTRLADYQAALDRPENRPVGAILRVHASNFRTIGFVEEVPVDDLTGLGVPVIDDVGSGVLEAGSRLLEGGSRLLAGEPSVRHSVAAGADVVCFSGDKLLGGPQAGLMVGRAWALDRIRRHPLARAVRIDKLCLAALEATLTLYREPARARREIPVLAMLEPEPGELAARAERLLEGLRAGGVAAELVASSERPGGGAVGGGALPLLELQGPAVALAPGELGPDEQAARLRRGSPPMVGRISGGRLLLDPRTMSDGEAGEAAGLVVRALSER